jgi:hypothetical protein
MKAYLIDPHTKTVSECEYNNEFTGKGGAYELLGCTIIEAVYMDEYPDNIFIDEEGRFKTQPGFATMLWPHGPLAGKAMVTGGADDKGEGTPTTLTLRQVADSIMWISIVPEL